MSDNKKRARQQPRAWKPSFPYHVDYNDHFESPKIAYRDVQPLMDWAVTATPDPVLYDPYYCDGQTKTLLRTLGYEHVVHEKRDFYVDIQNDSVPHHHVLVTNPPYSDEHKQKCLQYAMRRLKDQGTPFFLLLPVYVATKSYFRQLLETHGLLTNSDNEQQQQQQARMVYLVPQTDYAYDHPEGTGKEESPFRSMWFCGLPPWGRQHDTTGMNEYWNKACAKRKGQAPQLYTSLAELERAQVISTQHRPNPKQRKKMRKRLEQVGSRSSDGGVEVDPKEVGLAKADKAAATTTGKKKSKYRDNSDKRKRRRF